MIWFYFNGHPRAPTIHHPSLIFSQEFPLRKKLSLKRNMYLTEHSYHLLFWHGLPTPLLPLTMVLVHGVFSTKHLTASAAL